jgi:hypothetical protein
VAEYYRKLAAREGFQRAVVGVMAENRPDTYLLSRLQDPTADARGIQKCLLEGDDLKI